MKIDKTFIQRAFIVHLLLIIYFSSSNLSSFIGIILGFGMFTTVGISCFPSQNQNKQPLEKQQNQCTMNPEFLQENFNHFLNASLGKQLSTLISLYIITKISWYVPTWLLFIIVSETYVFWDILKENKLFEKIEGLVKLSKQSVEKAVNLIPKYETEANN